MLIRELSNRTGVSVRSLRYYEEKGLISSTRLENRYRHYQEDVVERVETIQCYIRLGFTTEQISGFLNCVLKHKEAFCTEITPLYEQKLHELDEQLHSLLTLKEQLESRFRQIQTVLSDNAPAPLGGIAKR